MHELDGKVIVITGASSGIGKVTAERLAALGARLFLAGRSAQAHDALVMRIRAQGGVAEHVALDLNDLSSVRAAAQSVLERHEPVDVLINNAGVGGRRDLTRQGLEAAFGVNHLGHFLLTQLLLPSLLAAPEGRVINVSSKAHYSAKGIDFEALTRPATVANAFDRYAVSKLCNVLHAAELARRYGSQGLRAYALHPGVVATGVWRHIPQPFRGLMKLFMLPEAEGATTSLLCATAPHGSLRSGGYYDGSKLSEPSAPAGDPALAAELWRFSDVCCSTTSQATTA